MFISFFLYSLVIILYIESEYIFIPSPPLTPKVFQPREEMSNFFNFFSYKKKIQFFRQSPFGLGQFLGRIITIFLNLDNYLMNHEYSFSSCKALFNPSDNWVAL